MFGYYTPLLILQFFCLYQVYTRKEEQKWYFIIFFLPFIGSLFYLYHTFYSRKNVKNITEEVKSNLLQNYKLDKLEKELNFSDTVANRINLAKEYMNIGNYEKGKTLLESCLNGIYQDDTELLMNLIKVYYVNKEYSKVIDFGVKIMNETEFKNSNEMASLAWSYYYEGKPKEGELIFEKMDMRYSNYKARLEYVKYFKETEQIELAVQKLEEMLTEIDSLNNYERKLNKKVFREIQNYYHSLIKSK